MVSAHRQNLFWYMLFLRLTPLIPNWFVNIASPLVNMPYHYFLGATFFGTFPQIYRSDAQQLHLDSDRLDSSGD